MARASSLSPPGMWRLTSLRTLPTSVVCVPRHCQARASLFTASLRSAVNKDRYGLRGDRLFPPAQIRLPHGTFSSLWSLHKFRDTPLHSGPWRSFSPRSQTIFDGFSHAITDAFGKPTESVSSRYAVNPIPTLAFPSRQRRDAALCPSLARMPHFGPRSSRP